MGDASRTVLNVTVSASDSAGFGRRGDVSGLTHHSDRGSQYCGHALQSALRRNGNDCSMSRKGNRRDNAVALSFFATLKKDPEHQCEYAAPEAARASVFEYIEAIYNRIRRHSFLGGMSPEQYEEQA